MKIFKTIAAVMLAIAGLAGTAHATVITPATSVDYGYIHGTFNITGNGADVLNLKPGQSFTISGNWSASISNASYCPACIIQLYLSGFGGQSGQINLFSGQGISASGSYNQLFTAPTTIGTYYIGGASNLDYQFDNIGGGANGAGLVNYQINVSVPEPATWAMMLVGLGLAGYALRSARKQAAKVTFA